ncbi:winged helix-turn-helix transcriptional regulator [Candidatus Pacearchaeota archaeon]|nr:winged helix-turn-helix transcriptional regulator [Candidatus Pacearchaeota archaeon]
MINKHILHHAHKHGFKKDDIYNAYKIFFGILVSESRLKIINALRHGKKNVSELMQELKMDQSNLSHDLARLKRCGFVTVEIHKKYRYYKLNEKTILPLIEIIDNHMSQYCIHILHARKNKMKGGHTH